MKPLFTTLASFTKKQLPRFWVNCSLLCMIMILGSLTGCTSFDRQNPSPVGTFYPNYPIQGVELMKDDFWHSSNRVSFSNPVKIKAVGIMTWNSLTGSKTEVALIESPRLDHLQGDAWIKAEGDYYVNISWLQENGRIEYTGQKTSGDYFWEGVGKFFTSPFGIFLVFAIIASIIIYRIVTLNSSRRSSIVSTTSGGTGDYSSSYESSYSSYSSSNESYGTLSSEARDQEFDEERNTGSASRCPDCQSIDLSGWGFTSKGNGRCKDCEGTGHDRATEAIVQFGTLGTEDSKYDCKTCSGTGQCQTCGGTGIV